MDCNEKHAIWLIVGMPMGEGLDGGVWYSLFIKNLAHYSSH